MGGLLVKKMMKKDSPAPPPAPDYKQLALDQHQLDVESADRAAASNRPNQYTTEGSQTWKMDPATGQWTSTVALSPENQALYDAQMKQKSVLSDAAGGKLQGAIDATSTPFDTSKFQDVRDFDLSKVHDFGADLDPNADQMTKFDTSGLDAYGNVDYSKLKDMPDAGFGAVESVRDAMLARTRPDLDQQRAKEIQRLKAQGFNENDRGMKDTYQRLDRKDVDAENQALLGATTAYGDIFRRGMDVRQQGAKEMLDEANFRNQRRGQEATEAITGAGFNNDILSKDFDQRNLASAYANNLRGQQINEQGLMRSSDMDNRAREIREGLMERSLPMQEYQQLTGMTQAVNPQFEDFSNVAGAKAADIAGANQAQYADATGKYNAREAQKAEQTAQLLQLAGTAVGGYFGGPMGAAGGAAAGRAVAPKANIQPIYSWSPNSSGGLSYNYGEP